MLCQFEILLERVPFDHDASKHTQMIARLLSIGDDFIATEFQNLVVFVSPVNSASRACFASA